MDPIKDEGEIVGETVARVERAHVGQEMVIETESGKRFEIAARIDGGVNFKRRDDEEVG